MSTTNDEFWHIPMGLWNLTHQKFHYENLNPPLLRVLSSVPLWLAAAETGTVAEGADKETRADAFVAANRDRYSQLVFLARLVPILISVLTGWVLAKWTGELFGSAAALLAAAMWTLSPNVIAHASLVTTDIASAGALLVVIRLAWKFAGAPSRATAVRLGLCIGLAQLIKFTFVLAYPSVVAVWLIRRVGSQEVERPGVLRCVAPGALIMLIAILTTNAGYLFHGSFRPLQTYEFQSQTMQTISAVIAPLEALPVPFPKDYVEGIDHQKHIMEGHHPVFLDGVMSQNGFPEYYVKTLWYKIPHATQFLFLLIPLAWLKRASGSRQTRLQLVLLVPIVLLLCVASFSSMQLGLRYLLPAFPTSFVMASQIVSVGRRNSRVSRFIVVVVVLCLAAELRYHPHHLSYFNEWSGGPKSGHVHLIDSNLDWGQGLIELKEYIHERQIEEYYLAYFGAVNPLDLGFQFQTVPKASLPDTLVPELQPGVYVVSANLILGRPGMVRTGEGDVINCNAYQFSYFYFLKPTDRIGNSMWIFRVSAADISDLRLRIGRRQ